MIRRLAYAAVLLAFTAAAASAQEQQLEPQAMQSLAAEIGGKLTGKRRIAVVPFPTIDGGSSRLGAFLAEELTTLLFGRNGVEIVERALLNKIMAELKLNATAAIDASSAKQLGKLLGADAIVTGTLTDLTTAVAVNCRLVDTQTGEVFAAARVRIAKDDDIKRLLQAQPAPTDSTLEEQPVSRSVGNTIGSPLPPVAATSRAPAAITVRRSTAFGFVFELSECRSSAGGIICNLAITNQREDSTLRLDDDSRLIDSRGRTFSSTRQTVGNLRTEKFGRAAPLLVRGVPAASTVLFENVGDDVTRIALLELKGFARNNWYSVQFRDVLVTPE